MFCSAMIEPPPKNASALEQREIDHRRRGPTLPEREKDQQDDAASAEPPRGAPGHPERDDA